MQNLIPNYIKRKYMVEQYILYYIVFVIVEFIYSRISFHIHMNCDHNVKHLFSRCWFKISVLKSVFKQIESANEINHYNYIAMSIFYILKGWVFVKIVQIHIYEIILDKYLYHRDIWYIQIWLL